MINKTDWDSYYIETPPLITKIARSITEHKLIRACQEIKHFGPAMSICELGGANSCFARKICDSFAVDHYHVVDLCSLGISLLNHINIKAKVTTEISDVLTPYSGVKQFDLVYSVGLIEHFDSTATKKAIEAHFVRCKKNGHVLISFPTHTWLYRLSRSLLERSDMWNFPDERPLDLKEIKNDAERYGVIKSETMNWWIGLTQGLLLIKKTI